MKKIFTFLFLVSMAFISVAQESVAREWNEVQLNCIRKYFAKPTVHARNLHHAGVVMYDMWAAYDQEASTYFLGKTVGGFSCQFNGVSQPSDVEAAREMALSYAMYRFLWNRYTSFAPPANLSTIQGYINAQMNLLGYDPSVTSTDYSDGDPAKLGNYIAAKMEEFALGDGSNQPNNYANVYYQPVNGDIWANVSGAGYVQDPNHWQELSLLNQIDQNGNLLENAPEALSHEWGNVVPFALTNDQLSVFESNGDNWKVYLHQGTPPLIDTTVASGLDDFFKWGFLMVAKWHSFHGIEDGATIDLSPVSTGGLNITDPSQLPSTFEEYQDFYNWEDGGTNDNPGYALNPVTGNPYTPQIVKRSDYTRVLSQFWADGPNSETPPGHWFSIINYVMDQPGFEKRWAGVGPILPSLEWDVKAYLSLGGAIHDAAVVCWGHKGYYDYIRPISAIRWMCEQGQSSDPGLPHYHKAGVPLIPGFIELVQPGDPLAGFANENVNKIKIYSWRGPYGFVASNGTWQGTQEDGVGWLLGERWWPYQTAGFVTPPFSGYFSGHSTYSRSGAESLTLITGSPYFPGGMGEFVAEPGYLTADSGPSETVKLQWATYRDASDQCSMSRIYGGLHPPQDDVPGRKAGLIIGPQAFEKANTYFDAVEPHVTVTTTEVLYNESNSPGLLEVHAYFSKPMDALLTPHYTVLNANPSPATLSILNEQWIDDQHYVWTFGVGDANTEYNNVVFKVHSAFDTEGNVLIPGLSSPVDFDTLEPTSTAVVSSSLLNDEVAATGAYSITINYDQSMDPSVDPTVTFTSDDPSATLTLNTTTSGWEDSNTYVVMYDVVDSEMEQINVDFNVSGAKDLNNNSQILSMLNNQMVIDTRNPLISSTTQTANALTDADLGTASMFITVIFDEDMDDEVIPSVMLSDETTGLSFNSAAWIDPMTLEIQLDLADENIESGSVDITLSGAVDDAGNAAMSATWDDVVDIDTKNPAIVSTVSTGNIISDATSAYEITVTFDEAMDTGVEPEITFPNEDPLENTLTFDGGTWSNETTYIASYTVADAGEELWQIDVDVDGGTDAMGNGQLPNSYTNFLDIDTRNPLVLNALANTYAISAAGNGVFEITALCDEDMDQTISPDITFPGNDLSSILADNGSEWLNSNTVVSSFDVTDNDDFIQGIDVMISGLKDLAGNPQESFDLADFFDVALGVGISEYNELYHILIYPNPVQSGNELVVYFENPQDKLLIQLIDVNGKVLSQEVTKNQQRYVRLETNKLAAGMYVLNISGNAGNATFNVSVTK